MWTSLFENSEIKRVLPGGQNWMLVKQVFDGIKMQIDLQGHSSGEKYTVEFNPIHFSVSEEWVEDYSGSKTPVKSEITLDSMKANIGNIWPEQKEDYSDLEAYFISAMDWNIRFISNEEPAVTKIK